MDFCEYRIVVELAAQPKNCINESGGAQRGKKRLCLILLLNRTIDMWIKQSVAKQM